MRKFVFILLTSVFFVSTDIRAQTLTLEDVIAQVNPSVFGVISELESGDQALGAGFLISDDGYVVTNYHVTENAKKITLEDIYGNQYSSEVIGSDQKTDISLLKTENVFNLLSAKFADSDDARVGNQVFAIGNPFGLGNSVSMGIISAKERDIEKGPYDNFLQTDATINQGNSGGPLFNLKGEIIGMNTAIFSENGQYAGIGFATPSNTVSWVLPQLKEKGKVTRGWLGFSVKSIKEKDTAKSLLVVSELAENSPAAEAGLNVGDVISELGEIPLNNLRLFSLEISKLSPNTEIPAVIIRDGEVKDLILKVSAMKDAETEDDFGLEYDNEKNDQQQSSQPLSFKELGIDKNMVINAQNLENLGIKAYFDEKVREMVIVEIAKDSPLIAKDVKVGDRIIDINETAIFGMDDCKTKVKHHLGNNKLILKMKNKNEIYQVVLSEEAINESN